MHCREGRVNSRRLAIVGMGYVGLVGAVCLAKMGHRIVGLDVDERKISLLKEGKLPIYEEGLEELFNEVKENLEFTTDFNEAISKTEACFVCVGTPSRRDGKVDLSFVRSASESIGEALKEKSDYYYVVFRSTIPPGTSQHLIIPSIERMSGKRFGEGFGYAFNPEFLREGTAIYDFFNPPKTVIGTTDKRTADFLLELYRELPEEKIVIPFVESEMVKYVDNTWHALKVDFANEIGYAAKQFGADGRLVMEVFCKDRKLNISPVYLKPGFAFGGSCLPKDVKGLVSLLRDRDIKSPVVESIMPSNFIHIRKARHLIESVVPKGELVVIIGVAFKPGTDDVRETPAIYLARELLDAGYTVKYYDPLVRASHVKAFFGDFIEITDEDFFSSLDEALSQRNLVFTGSFKDVPRQEEAYIGKRVFDLNGIFYEDKELREKIDYYALCW